jgi:hypothetical protein
MKRLLLALLFVSVVGCEVRDEAQVQTFQSETCEYVLLVAVDRDYVANHKKAFEFLQYAIDKYFSDRMGSRNDQIIIAELSGSPKSLLWQGTPEQLRQDFPDQEAFRKYMLANGNEGCRINEGLAESIKYLLKTHSVAFGKAKTAALILSSFQDDQPNSEESEVKLLDALTKLAKRGGIGFYFVDRTRMDFIEEKMTKAGFPLYTIECDIHGRPPLPTFE